MDQIIKRPAAESTQSVQAALGLDENGKSRKPRRLWRYILLLAVMLAALGAFYYWSSQPAARIIYSTAPVKTGDLTIEVSATGTLQPLTQVDISSELSGVVRTVEVNENQEIAQGAVLARLDTTRLAAQVERAEASAAAADAKVTEAKTTLKETEQTRVRAEQLAARGMTTQQALETAVATRDRAESAVKSAEANLAIAVADLKLQQADLEKSTIYAPIDGVVLTRSVDPGQTVASSLQAPVLFVIAADLKKMELKAAIDEADIGGVKSGQNARFTVDAFPERQFDAEIRDIAYASVTTDGVVTYDARLEVDNEELLLRPGMTATVAVVTKEAKDIMTVPTAAFRYRPPATESRRGWSLQNLFMPPRMGRSGRGPNARSATASDGTRTLYVLKNGAPEAVQVKIGSTDGEFTEVVSGLSEGDQVITSSAPARN